MYSFVTNKQEKNELRCACEQIIKNVQRSSLKEYFTFQFELIGSGSLNILTKNGENGEYDLDYNLIIQKDKQGLIDNPKRIKDLFMKAFNEANPTLGFKSPENSTSVITSKLIYDDRLHFSFDVAIMCEGYDGDYLKIKYNRSNDLYYWNQVKDSSGYKTKIKALKSMNLWVEAKERYLEKKNMYLKRNEEKASFSILLEVLKEMNDVYHLY